ncbi:putative oxidoreductase [Trypanosoma theileri]|uniref:Putative oxidoreductase n=1 Tax=Trypanosoma theileri TaxID=67003 RepID=A0A1X0NX22_9TRYP|nr:putative oxidoreductase [Trypanosoma theileri]ORC89254.1 putative oxidoreductase [Trypanosoma theileri]
MTSVPKTRLRIGVLGAARVLRKTWVAIHDAGHEITVVGCRDVSRAQKFVDELSDSVSFVNKPIVGSYEDVVMSRNVDIVYIPIPAAIRHKWVLLCAEHGKHVVCEKPAAASCKELEEWLQRLAAKRLLFIDGTMLSHGKRVHDVRHAIGEIGKLRRMEAHFTFSASDDFIQNDIRLDPALEPMGALGDLGWYCVRYFLHMVDFTLPSVAMGRVVQRSGPKNGISAFSGDLLFTVDGDPVWASFFCSFHSAHEQLVRLHGDDGMITVHGAINPTDVEVPTYTIERGTLAWSDGLPTFQREVTSRRSAEDCSFQMVQLWRDVAVALMRGESLAAMVVPEKSGPWARSAWATQRVCEALLQSAQSSAARAAAAMATTTTTTTTTAVGMGSEKGNEDTTSVKVVESGVRPTTTTTTTATATTATATTTTATPLVGTVVRPEAPVPVMPMPQIPAFVANKTMTADVEV